MSYNCMKHNIVNIERELSLFFVKTDASLTFTNAFTFESQNGVCIPLGTNNHRRNFEPLRGPSLFVLAIELFLIDDALRKTYTIIILHYEWP